MIITVKKSKKLNTPNQIKVNYLSKLNKIKYGVKVTKTRLFEGKDPTIDPNHPSTKIGQPSSENPNKAPLNIKTTCNRACAIQN